MEFCTDPKGRQAKAPEQRISVANSGAMRQHCHRLAQVQNDLHRNESLILVLAGVLLYQPGVLLG
jgi:hypothetical protein